MLWKIKLEIKMEVQKWTNSFESGISVYFKSAVEQGFMDQLMIILPISKMQRYHREKAQLCPSIALAILL